jgi:hypothetical protein
VEVDVTVERVDVVIVEGGGGKAMHSRVVGRGPVEFSLERKLREGDASASLPLPNV